MADEKYSEVVVYVVATVTEPNEGGLFSNRQPSIHQGDQIHRFAWLF